MRTEATIATESRASVEVARPVSSEAAAVFIARSPRGRATMRTTITATARGAYPRSQSVAATASRNRAPEN